MDNDTRNASYPEQRAEQIEYEVIAANEEQHARFELRRYPDRWEACYLRRKVGGGWYVKDSIAVMTDV